MSTLFGIAWRSPVVKSPELDISVGCPTISYVEDIHNPRTGATCLYLLAGMEIGGTSDGNAPRPMLQYALCGDWPNLLADCRDRDYVRVQYHPGRNGKSLRPETRYEK